MDGAVGQVIATPMNQSRSTPIPRTNGVARRLGSPVFWVESFSRGSVIVENPVLCKAARMVYGSLLSGVG